MFNQLSYIFFIPLFIATISIESIQVLPLKNSHYKTFNENTLLIINPIKFVDFYKKTNTTEEVISILNMKLKSFKIINDTSLILKFSARDTILYYVGNFDSIPKIDSYFKKGETITVTKKPSFESEISVSVASNKKFSMFKYVIE